MELCACFIYYEYTTLTTINFWVAGPNPSFVELVVDVEGFVVVAVIVAVVGAVFVAAVVGVLVTITPLVTALVVVVETVVFG